MSLYLNRTLAKSYARPRAAFMNTFPMVKRLDKAKWGEYSIKRNILEIYAEFAVAPRTGSAYKACLNPSPGPPADPKGNFLPLPEWKPGQPKPPNWPSHIHPPKGVID